MKRLLISFVCLLILAGLSWSPGQDIAKDDKPPITKPDSTETTS